MLIRTILYHFFVLYGHTYSPPLLLRYPFFYKNVFNKYVQTYAVVRSHIPCMNLIICGLSASCMDTIQKVVSFVFIFLNIFIIKNNYQVIIFRYSNDVMKRHLKHLNKYFV